MGGLPLALKGCDTVVHAAARVHIMNDAAADPLSEYRRTNVDGTLKLATQAIESGVRRFVFVSSIKVNGEETLPDQPFRADSEPMPVDPYGISKLEAERGLQNVLAKGGVEWVVIRPTLVYGPGVKGNFLTMMRWLQRGVPLPFASIRNKRSLVALDNLVSLIERCVTHSAAANQVFLAADGEDLSTPELLERIAGAMGKRSRLFPVPPSVLHTLAGLVGRVDLARRLMGSLQVDIRKTRDLLGWSPVVTVQQALEATVEHFLRTLRP